MRLLLFNIFRGNLIGFHVILKQFGFPKTVRIVSKMQYTLLFDNPFKVINKKKKPDRNARLSQKQMAPLIVLHDILLNEGIERDYIVSLLAVLCNEVAVAFLSFNIPVIKKEKYQTWPKQKKMFFLQKIAGRFFNAGAVLEMNNDDAFSMTVTHCYFSEYSESLGKCELGPLFCASDRCYFEKEQPDILFERNNTLAEDKKPCDFSFSWKEAKR